ncbi:hypothetical protein CL635_01045 [bacterium]|nr:hypothetical protein [bacterium]|tara:strand:- start:14768 stop:15415 length:648 start_codon:yes stop_codon:yes gene_type:complete
MSSVANTIFNKAAKADASDVHIAVGSPIVFRVNGELEHQGKQKNTAAKVDSFIKSVLGAAQYKKFKEEKELDTSYSTSSGIRLRINCHYERGKPGLAARIIPTKIPKLEDIGMADLEYLCEETEGLILFTGPTGAGKSTSLAAMIQHIAAHKGGHIVTMEDPIEFVFQSEKGLVVSVNLVATSTHSQKHSSVYCAKTQTLLWLEKCATLRLLLQP